jgi:hypothetical protein
MAEAEYLSMPGKAPVFFSVFTVTATAASESRSSKNSQPSWISWPSGSLAWGMASADRVIGNQPFVEPKRMARASSSQSSSKWSRWGCLPRQLGRFSFPALPKACAMLRDAPQASHFTHRFSVCNEAPLSKKRSVPLQAPLPPWTK